MLRAVPVACFLIWVTHSFTIPTACGCYPQKNQIPLCDNIYNQIPATVRPEDPLGTESKIGFISLTLRMKNPSIAVIFRHEVSMARTVAASAITGEKDRNDMWKSSLRQTKKKVTDNDDSWCAPTPFLFNFVDLVVLSLLLLLLSSQVLLALFCAFRCLGCAFSSIFTGLFFPPFHS